MRLGMLLVVGALLLAALTGALAGQRGHGAIMQQAIIEEEGGEYVCRFVLASPSGGSYTIYYFSASGPERSVVLRIPGQGRVEAVVSSGEKSIIATIDVPRGGATILEARISGGPLQECPITIVASGDPGKWFLTYTGAAALLVLPGYALLAAVSSRWNRHWLPLYSAALLVPLLASALGQPGAGAWPARGFSFTYYTSLLMLARRSVVSSILMLAAVGGSLSSYYPRAGQWEASESLLGSWGFAPSIRRALLYSAGLALSFAGALIGYLTASGALDGILIVGDLRVAMAFLARDTVCVLLVSAGWALLFSGLSMATRSPLLSLVLGVVVSAALLTAPCALGTGGMEISEAGVKVRLALDKMVPAVEWSIRSALIGMVLHLYGWWRR